MSKPPLGQVASHLVWPRGGSATPRPAVWGQPNHPQCPRGWFGCPLGQTPKGFFFRVWPKWRPNHPLGHWGWFGHPQTASLGVAKPPLGQTGWAATPANFFFFWIVFKKNKIYDEGILGIKMPK